MGSLAAIINADDLGMSEEVNAAIFDLMAAGRVSSATVMANGPAVRHAVDGLKRFTECSFGAHLNLTQFEPVGAGASSRLLVDGEGQMTRAIERSTPGPALLAAMYDELCAQAERLASLGVNISHVDSHNHVHTRPAMLLPLKALQRRYGVRKVRISKNLYAPSQPCASGLMWKKRAYNWALRHVYRTTTTDVFTDLLSFCAVGPDTTPAYRSVELMVHPGAAYAAEETAVLRSDWIERSGLQLIDYARLHG